MLMPNKAKAEKEVWDPDKMYLHMVLLLDCLLEH